MWVTHKVGPLGATEGTCVVAHGWDREGEAILEGGHTSYLPSAQNRIDRSFQVRSVTLTASEGQLIDIAQYQALGDIVRVERLLGGQVVVVPGLLPVPGRPTFRS